MNKLLYTTLLASIGFSTGACINTPPKSETLRKVEQVSYWKNRILDNTSSIIASQKDSLSGMLDDTHFALIQDECVDDTNYAENQRGAFLNTNNDTVAIFHHHRNSGRKNRDFVAYTRDAIAFQSKNDKITQIIFEQNFNTNVASYKTASNLQPIKQTTYSTQQF